MELQTSIFSDALDELSDAIFIFDQNDQIVYYNNFAHSAYPELSVHLKKGAHLSEIFRLAYRITQWRSGPPSEQDYVREQLELYRAASYESEWRLDDGRWILIRSQCLQNGLRVCKHTDISAIKKRENKLAASNSRHSALHQDFTDALDALPLGVLVVNAGLEVEIVNDAFNNFWNTRSSTVRLGTHFRDLLEENRSAGIYGVEDDEWYSYVKTRCEEIRQAKISPRLVKRPSGQELIFSIIELSQGRRLLTYLDVTEQNRHQNEIERSKEEAATARNQLQDAIETIDDGFALYDAQDRLIICNDSFREVVGKDTEFIIAPGSTYEQQLREMIDLNLIPGIDSTKDAYVRELLEKRSRLDGKDVTYQNNSGDWIRQRDKRIPSGNIVSLRTDISEHKRREAELEAARAEADRERQRLIDAIEVLEHGFAIYDADSRLALYNHAFTELNSSIADLIKPGVAYVDLLKASLARNVWKSPPDDLDQWIKQHLELRRTETSINSLFQFQDGRWMRRVEKRTSTGEWVGIRSDITATVERERELEAAHQQATSADRAKSEFLANMSHEIRTPMNGVMGMAELLSKSGLDPKQAMFSDVIVRSGNALLTIINDILDFSKIDAGQLELELAPFTLADAFEDVAALLSSKAAEKGLELILRIDPTLPKMLVGDVSRTRQIVTNLLGNAIKFTENGHVCVNVENISPRPGNGKSVGLRVSVVDTGMGIPADEIDKVFDKFSQIDGSATRRHEGTGLGLSIAASLVELMGGKIGVESKERAGSTFWFEVTLAKHFMAESDPVPAELVGSRVLVVINNALNRSNIAEQLVAWQFDYAAVASGAAALQFMREAISRGVAIDCVIADYQMPQMNGGELVNAMRMQAELENIPVIMMTAINQEEYDRSLSFLDNQRQLIKPVRNSLLLDAIVHSIGDKADVTGRPKWSDSTNDVLDILVCENIEGGNGILSGILLGSAYSTVTVSTSEQILDRSKKQIPRLILIDVSMPDMHIMQTAQAVREIENGKTYTPIIGFTSQKTDCNLGICRKAGLDDCLSTFTSPDRWLDIIDTWLGKSRAVAING